MKKFIERMGNKLSAGEIILFAFIGMFLGVIAGNILVSHCENSITLTPSYKKTTSHVIKNVHVYEDVRLSSPDNTIFKLSVTNEGTLIIEPY